MAESGQKDKTNNRRYRVEIYNIIIDLILTEINDCFNDIKFKLLTYVSCFLSNDNFAHYDKKN